VNDWIVLTEENMLAAVLVASGFLIWWSVKFLAAGSNHTGTKRLFGSFEEYRSLYAGHDQNDCTYSRTVTTH
jgi:hypothetical protein